MARRQRTVTPLRQTDLPTVNMLIKLSLHTTGGPNGGYTRDGLPSRVEDLLDDDPGVWPSVIVAAPSFPGDAYPPTAEDACVVSWMSDRGRYELPVSLQASIRLAGGLRCWQMTATAPAERIQRRQFFRVSCALPITVTVLSEHQNEAPPEFDLTFDPMLEAAESEFGVAGLADTEFGVTEFADSEIEAVPVSVPVSVPMSGRTQDLSEGGLRCSVAVPPRGPTGQGEAGLAPGTVVMARILTGEGTDSVLSVRSVVVWARRRQPTGGAARSAGVIELAMAFNDPLDRSDELRKLVYREQIRLRRLATS